jgi:drug/metabolite transporter, DME family
LDRLYLLAAAVLFSTGGVVIKGSTLTPWQIASFRSAVAAVCLYVFARSARRSLSWRLLPAGVPYALTLITFVLATRYTTSANAIFLESTAPLYLIVIGPLLLRERLRATDLAVIAAVAVGMALLFAGEEQPNSTAPSPALGNAIAAASGVFWALTITSLRWFGRAEESFSSSGGAVIVGNALAALFAMPFAVPVISVSAGDVLLLLYLGIVQIGLAYLCLSRGLQRVPAFEASTILLAEPVLNPIWTWLILGERPAGLAIAGGVVILAATLMNGWWHSGRTLPLENHG